MKNCRNIPEEAKYTAVSLLSVQNASFPMLVTLLPIVTLVRPLQP